MPLSPADAVHSFRAFPAEQRRAVFADIVRDIVARDGHDEAIRLFLANVFDSGTPLMERQLETLAAFARLPKDVAARLLAPFDPESIRVEDCLSDDEVERMVAGAGG
jgi:hypothetical protein